MTDEFYNHVANNSEVFDLWITNNSILEPSADILQPLIKPFEAENPGVNIRSCKDCIIDMLIWAKIQLKNKPKNERKQRNKENNS